ncbi:MAG: lytic transglycosylase domain-containing protein [Gammaproteobacteria bacterium]|nr:lytic transglycosylase domain-containing protein [Gammaproteobacteria bacterium]MCB1923419.1 lytic transglycosylase domain-containing protein [Gammaproteobacteria bacterium]
MRISAFVFGILCSAVLASSAVCADVYKYRDAQGNVLLTDQPMRGMTLLKRYRMQTGRSAASSAPDTMAQMRARRRQLDPLIERAALAAELQPALVHAVVRAESSYRTDAVSSKGAVGLMQLMPGTAERYGVSDRRDAAENLRGGTEYLRDLLQMFENDLELAVAAYNAGENAVIRYGNKIPPYDETQGYVRKVLRFYQAMNGEDKLALR